jgi:hypothetical protein
MMGVLWVVGMREANAELSTTTVQGTVYLANGVPGSGMLHVSWPAFTAANGQAIVADSVDVTIGQDGFLSVKLTPNQGAMPSGLYYTAVYYMSDGSVSTQYWVVPAAAQASLAQVQAQVMPAAQAVQTLTRSYVDDAITQLTQSLLTGSGGSLTGPLYLSGDPTQPLQAADKHYVDLAVGQAGSNFVSPAVAGQIAIYAANGTSINGTSTVPVSAGGTGSVTADAALRALGGVSTATSSVQTLAGPLRLSASYDSNTANLNQAASAQNVQNVAPRSVKEFGARGNGIFGDYVATAGSKTIQLVDGCCGYNFTPSVVGYLIGLPMVDSDHKTLYTTITGYIDSTHVTVATAPTYSFDGTGTFLNQAIWMADDSAAISAALAGVTSARGPGVGNTREGGGALMFPCGYYGLSTQLSIPGGVIVDGMTSGCAVLMYMGTAAVDAAVEVSPVANTNWLRNGFYMNPSYTNHAEIGSCSGASCSPNLPGGYASGAMKNLRIYGNKYSNWALSVLLPYDYMAENIAMGGGATGCFYTLNDVQVTWTHLFCGNENIYGNGSPVNGLYFDGSGPGQGPIPMRVQSPWVTDATGAALTFNWVASATVADAQVSVSHQSLNVMSTSGGITFQGDLFEGGATGQIADVVAGGGDKFINSSFTGLGGVTLSGPNNSFDGVTVVGPQTLTISGPNNSFLNSIFSNGLTVADTAKTTRYLNVYDYNVGPKYNFPSSQEAVLPMSGMDSVVRVSGFWYTGSANTPYPIATTHMTAGSAWKAVCIGNWYYYGVAASMPDILELTDVANTVTFNGQTLTFSITPSGIFSVQSAVGINFLGFSGYIYILPRTVSAGSGGNNAMQLAGNMQAPSVQVGSGTAMTGNQGNGAKVQHSTGTTTADHCVKFDANGNVVDAGSGCGGNGVTLIASGSNTLSSATISAGICATTDSVTAPGVVVTDVITLSPNSVDGANEWNGWGYIAFPTADHVNFVACNYWGVDAAPNVTMNWRVQR